MDVPTFFETLLTSSSGVTFALGVVATVGGFIAGRTKSRADIDHANAETRKLNIEARKLEQSDLEEAEGRTQRQIIQGFESLAKSYSDSLNHLQATVDAQSRQLSAQSAQLDAQGQQLAQLRQENCGLRQEVHDLQTHINVMIAAMRTDAKAEPGMVPLWLEDNAERILQASGVDPDCPGCKYEASCAAEPALKVLRIAGRMCDPHRKRVDRELFRPS